MEISNITHNRRMAGEDGGTYRDGQTYFFDQGRSIIVYC